jgi:Flp pilus assembly protein TadB
MTEPTPTSASEAPALPRNLWLHGLFMLVLVVLVQLAQTILGVCAVFQFCWMLFAKERNVRVARFGAGLAHWLAVSARFVTGGADERPFPWSAWDEAPPGQQANRQ